MSRSPSSSKSTAAAAAAAAIASLAEPSRRGASKSPLRLDAAALAVEQDLDLVPASDDVRNFADFDGDGDRDLPAFASMGERACRTVERS